MGETLKLLYSAEEAASALDIDRKTLLAHVRCSQSRCATRLRYAPSGGN